MYLQQLNKDKKKKKKKKKEKEPEDQMFISDSDDDEKNLRNITKNVDSMIRGKFGGNVKNHVPIAKYCEQQNLIS